MAITRTLEIGSLRVVVNDEGEPSLETYDSSDGTWDTEADGADVLETLRSLAAFTAEYAKKGA